nr:sulfurtransferase [uncultured Sphingomonas sp.]
MDELVSAGWLAGQLGADDIAIVDSSFFLPTDHRNPAAEFTSAHIPGARFLDISKVADQASSSPHMLPSAADFAAAMTALGVGSGDRIIVYDNSPLRTAARGWFMFRHFGAERVAILDGGFQKWVSDGMPVELGPARPRAAVFEATERPDEVVTKAELIIGADLPIADARGAGRFEGTDPEPRAGMASGHIPGARNVPMTMLYRADGTFKSDEELAAAFAAGGVDPLLPFIATCGSGVTANSLIFASRRLGGRGHRLYDGSWSEWGLDPAAPKATGKA